MKTAILFKSMENLVNKHVEAWKTDFDIDKKTIKDNPTEKTYYWYLRDCGTQLMSETDMKYIETGVPIEAEHWLPRARAIYKIDVPNQTLTLIKEKIMTDLIAKASHMNDATKLEYLLKWMSNKKFKTVERPWEILYRNANFIKLRHYKVDSLVNKGAGIKEILDTLTELSSLARVS